ncbi:MAG: hypothetical protein KGK04_08365, partial [Xanthomonadaceae bacterium]|nr:hypothetical protein [Xanthomonadaceae bacterium]
VYGGTVDKLDTRTEQVRSVDPTLAYPLAHYRGAWTLPLAFSKRGKRTLYFANQRLFRTTDGGDHWAPISPDLTRADAATPANLDAPTAADDSHVGKRRGVIYSIAPSPLDAKTLWVGTDDGLVWRSTDDGAHWQAITPKALTPWSKVAGIEPSHFDPNVAYLAIDRHRLDDDTPYIYRTADGGKSWTRIDSGIPRNSFVNVVREDPRRSGLLYAGTERGVYVSFDDGAQWQPLQQNLPVTSVRDIDVHGDDLVIATHGRGFWIMDDVTALRQLANVHADTATLFKPAVAWRVRPAGFTGTPFPKDEPMAANPPDGAIIDYLLPAGVHGPVTLTVRDAQGRVVRSYSSAEKFATPNPAKLDIAPEWVPVPVRLSTAPGMHRFVWNLRYPRPGAHKADQPQKDGVWAPPGQYSVELDVDGRSLRQPLSVQPDPRVHLSSAAYQRQFVLARQVEDASVRAMAATASATAELRSLEAREAHADAATRARIEAVAAKLADVSGVQAHPDPRNSMGAPPKRVDSLRALSMNLMKLEQAVDGADADPSADAQASYTLLSKTLGATLAEWQALQTGELATLDASLPEAGQRPVNAH